MSDAAELTQLFATTSAERGELHGWHTVWRYGDWAAEHRALTQQLAVADLTGWSQLELTGADRAKFLHNLCTNEVRRLEPGEAREACFTSSQGRVLGHGWIFVTPERLSVQTMPGQAAALAEHLDRYLIREKVTIADRSRELATLLVAGAEARPALAAIGLAHLPEKVPSVSVHESDAGELEVRRCDLFTADEYFIVGPFAAVSPLAQTLLAMGAQPVGARALEVARIERGTPWQGIDILEKTLPQELARDERVLSFVKGCYIGQETVARLDALGHVNKTLCGLRFAGEQVPPVGTPVQLEEKTMGQVTSAAWTPGAQSAVGLAYLRVGANTPGQVLTTEFGEATVVSLPQ